MSNLKSSNVVDDSIIDTKKSNENFSRDSVKCLVICTLLIGFVMIAAYLQRIMQIKYSVFESVLAIVYIIVLVINITGFKSGITGIVKKNENQMLAILGLLGNGFLLLVNLGLIAFVFKDVYSLFQ